MLEKAYVQKVNVARGGPRLNKRQKKSSAKAEREPTHRQAAVRAI